MNRNRKTLKRALFLVMATASLMMALSDGCMLARAIGVCAFLATAQASGAVNFIEEIKKPY